MRIRPVFGVVASLLSAQVAFGDSASEVPVGVLEGRIVEGASLAPIEGATIIVTDTQKGPVVATGTTDPNGWFHYKVPPGSYDILGIFGDARWIHHNAKVDRGKVTQVPGTLSIDAEMVTVHEKTPRLEHRPPEAVRSTVKAILPYSDQAIDENVWAVGWMLLDVDEQGIVTGFRFLHHPGYGLDKIAEDNIWGLRFKPAVDAGGQPMISKVLWKVEWPAFHYAKDHKLFGLGGQGAVTPSMEGAARNDAVAHNVPTLEDSLTVTAATGQIALYSDDGRLDAKGQPKGFHDVLDSRYGSGALGPGQFVLPEGVHKPPCKGSAPMNLDMHEPLYRDCTPPNLGNVNSEPVVKRPER